MNKNIGISQKTWERINQIQQASELAGDKKSKKQIVTDAVNNLPISHYGGKD